MTGIVVQHKATGNTYAVSEENFNPKTESKVRELKAWESPRSFAHKPKTSKSGSATVATTASTGDKTVATNSKENK